ncbi:unnamed protein product, partial [Polarella glacialis]
NCGAGMNSKFLTTSSIIPLQIRLFSMPLFFIVDALLKVRPLVEFGFQRLATKETISKVLEAVYVNAGAVDDELIDGVLEPAADPGALDVFVNVLTGDPGCSADEYLPSVRCPVRLIWGTEDTVTPLNGELAYYGTYFRELADDPSMPHITLKEVLAGHVPQDDSPEEVHQDMLSWLANPPPFAMDLGTKQSQADSEDGLDLDDLVF